MSPLRRIVLVRHGETEGNSSVRFHGRNDLPLSEEGRTQLRDTRRALRPETFELLVASPLRRSWEAAWILAGGAPVRLERDFREVDFGRWEGLTLQEIEAADPVLFRDWQDRVPGFVYPGGEARAAFVARVERGLARLQGSGARSALVAVHKGVVRAIAEKLLSEPLAPERPELGGVVALSRQPSGVWIEGTRGSDPEALRGAA